MEDLELAQQMDSLGLPISFSTTSEKRNVATRGRKKGMRLGSLCADKNIENVMPGVFGVGEWKDITSSSVFHDCTNLPGCCKTTEGQIAAFHHDVEEEHNRGPAQSDGEFVDVLSTVFSDCGNEQNSDGTEFSVSSYADKNIIPDGMDLERNAEFLDPGIVEDASSGFYQERKLSNKQEDDTYLEGSSISCHISGAKSDGDDIKTLQSYASSVESSVTCALVDNYIEDYPDNSIGCEFGDWRVFWDAFYMRNYFYNFQTQESTWYPPPGLEHLRFSCSTSNSQVFADEAKEDGGIGSACDAIQDQDAHSLQDRIDSSQENGCNVTYIDQPLQEISSRMNYATGISMSVIGGLAENCASEQLHKDAEAKEYDELITLNSSEVEGYAIDELVGRGYLDKQEENATRPGSRNVSDVSLDDSVNDSVTRTLNEVGSDENWLSGRPETYMTSTVDELVSHHEIAALKKKKRVRRLQSHFTSGVIGSLPVNILKYWCQRYLLFSRFDNGIKMDEEGWFSVTPEPIARHHASRCGSGTVIDCFTGVGGNAIQFALRSNHVIAIDIDPQRIDYAQHNAAIYGVDSMIDFIKGDFFKLAPHLKGDCVFMSPPWGGPDYARVQTYDITSMLKPRDGHSLFKIARMIASKVVMFLPRNVDVNQLAELSLSVDPPWALEVEKSFLNGKLKAITAYFSKKTT